MQMMDILKDRLFKKSLAAGLWLSLIFSYQYKAEEYTDIQGVGSQTARSIWYLRQHIHGYGLHSLLMASAIAAGCYFGTQIYNAEKEKKSRGRSLLLLFISLIFGVLNYCGLSMYYLDTIPAFYSVPALLGGLILSLSYAGIFYFISGLFFCLLERYWVLDPEQLSLDSSAESEHMVCGRWIMRHDFLFPFLIILLFWIPWIIMYYPASADNDVFWQMSTYFGYDGYARSNHHPWFSTMAVVSFYKLGMKLGNENLGLFLYVIVRDLCMAAMLAYGIHAIKKESRSPFLYYAVTAYFAVTPIWGVYAKHAFKDTFAYALFSFAVLNLFLSVIQLRRHSLSVKRLLLLGTASLFACLFRNNFIYALLPGAVLLTTVLLRQKRFVFAALVMIPFLLYHGYNSYIYNVLGVAPTEKKEALSLPLQQTARTVKYYRPLLTQEENRVLGEFFYLDQAADAYDPVVSDPVKNIIHLGNASSMDYMRIWAEMGLKYENTYIEAAVGLGSGYYAFIPRFPDHSGTWNTGMNIWGWLGGMTSENYHVYNPDSFRPAREIMEAYANLWDRLPLLNLTDSCALYTWICALLICFLIDRRKWLLVIPFVPIILLIGTCIASPVNDCFRYFAPAAASLPWALCFSRQGAEVQ